MVSYEKELDLIDVMSYEFLYFKSALKLKQRTNILWMVSVRNYRQIYLSFWELYVRLPLQNIQRKIPNCMRQCVQINVHIKLKMLK